MKREKSRKPFIYYLITREMMAFFVAAIIILAATYALYYSFGNGVKNVEKAYTHELVEKVHKTGENIDELDEQELDYRFRFMCGYESELSDM